MKVEESNQTHQQQQKQKQLNDCEDDDLPKWTENGPPKHWVENLQASSSFSDATQKSIKEVVILPCSLLVKYDPNKTALQIVKNTEKVVQTISLQVRNFKTITKQQQQQKEEEEERKTKKNDIVLKIATVIGILGVATTAIGITLLAGAGAGAGCAMTMSATATTTATAVAEVTTVTATTTATAAGGATVAATAAVAAVAGVGAAIVQTFHSSNGKKRLLVFGTGGGGKRGGKGGDGTQKEECKVGFIRPNITIDEEWNNIVFEIIKTHAPASAFQRQQTRSQKMAKKIKNHKWIKKVLNQDADIHNCQLEKEEMVFLLITRTINDKQSTLSIVYKNLIARLKERAFNNLISSHCIRNHGDRSTRQDAHAIIKHITAILIQDQPEFGSSPTMLEISTSCVESLVLSEIYDVIFEEIISQTRQEDLKLEEKIQSYHWHNSHVSIQSLIDNCSNNITNFFKFHSVEEKSDYENNDNNDNNTNDSKSSQLLLCDRAIKELQSLPTHRTIPTKLQCCADILKAISDHGQKQNISADKLLESVCYHIIHANVPNLNAECLFLEEFASDDQLVRGLEGYALITLLASLSYLNNCDCIETSS